MELQRQLLAFLEQDCACATVTVVHASGSVPNDVGAMMLVDAEGRRVVGTVGGGGLEHRALAEARAALGEGVHRRVALDLTEEQFGGIGMRCGGHAELYIHVYQPRLQLVLFGAGHVNRALGRMAEVFGYAVTVIDERAQWCNSQNYPHARRLALEVPEALAALCLGPQSYCVIATRDHAHDATVLRALVDAPVPYIGMVASRRKALSMVKAMVEEGIVVTPLLQRLAAPVGLALGGRSPADVALSILAEIQSLKSGGTGVRLGLTLEEFSRALPA